MCFSITNPTAKAKVRTLLQYLGGPVNARFSWHTRGAVPRDESL